MKKKKDGDYTSPLIDELLRHITPEEQAATTKQMIQEMEVDQLVKIINRNILEGPTSIDHKITLDAPGLIHDIIEWADKRKKP